MQDGSEYLFACNDEKLMLEWVAKIKFHASLTPAQQLRSFDRGETPPLDAPPPRPGETPRRHTTEVGSPTHDSPTFHLSADEKRPSVSSETFVQTTTLVVPDINSLPRSMTPPHAIALQYASLPRSSKGYLPTHYPRQSTLSACGSSSSISSAALPAIVKPGMQNNGTLQRKSKSVSSRHSVYESVYDDDHQHQQQQQQQIIVDAATGSVLLRETVATKSYYVKREASTESAQGSQASGLQNGDGEVSAASGHHGSTDSGSSTSRQAKGDGSDFIAWVESQGGTPSGTPQQHHQHDDTDSVKKKKAFSFFKRGSKHGKESKQ
ncbi:hypothetical protein Tcan_08446 [Toxocara canis]|uniref:PH domain-containing protein n=1 Tax=Toxocara canis TaxID=6265 RepID=A0A0B2VZ06_TOXCA|nr:hypothetical protein Tcan_08446 [Toxocara canis]